MKTHHYRISGFKGERKTLRASREKAQVLYEGLGASDNDFSAGT